MPELLELLKEASTGGPPALFALAASYFDGGRLREAENRLVQRGQIGQKLREYRLPLSGVHSACVDWLQGAAGVERDQKELLLLKALDARLTMERGRSLLGPHLGVDGREYWVCKRNTFLADHLSPRPSWAADQSPSIATYCHHHVLVPTAPVNGVRISPIAKTQWGSEQLHGLLKRHRFQLTLMARPFTRVQYPPLDEGNSSATVLVDKVLNEDELIDEATEVVAEAARERATILLFPELTFTERMLQHLAALLKKKPTKDGPLLTVAGCCHRPREGARSALNEALLFGPDGKILHRHAKLTRYTWQETGKPRRAEATETGTELAVLECALGNLAITICLDLFASSLRGVVDASHGNLFLVPSQSNRIGDHRSAARSLMRSHRAATLVANQHQGDRPTAKESSFVLLPGGAPHEWPPEGQATPTLSLIFRPRLLDSDVGQ